MLQAIVVSGGRAAGVYGENGSRRGVADVVDTKALSEVRAFKKAAKAAERS